MNFPLNFDRVDSVDRKSVVSGQQVGILGGSLFVLFKAIGAIVKATEENKKEPGDWQAIYWLETNDSDLDEIRTFNYYNHISNTKHSFTWSKSSTGEPIGQLVIDQELNNQISNYLSQLPRTPHSAELIEVVKTAFALRRKLGEANHDLLRWVFQDQPIALFDPQNEKFTEFSQPILWRELESTEDGSQANSFALIRGRRTALFRRGDDYQTRRGRSLTSTELKELTLLPNLQTRSLLQDSYLNARYYIAGPSEVIYLAGLKGQYQKHKITPAEVIPRMSSTLIMESLEGHVEEIGDQLNPNDYINESSEILLNKYSKIFIDLKTTEKDLRNQKNKWVEDFDLSRKEERLLYKNIKHYLGNLRKNFKIEHAKKLNVIRLISQQLYRQERTYNYIDFLNLYGRGLIEKLIDEYRFEKKKISLGPPNLL